MELAKDRARLVLDRYGIVFRQLLQREAPPFQWSSIFRALRLMELSGEVVGGCFFKNIHGLQFAKPRMVRLLGRDLPDDRIFWINAQDPASICGLGIESLHNELPRRSAGTHLVYMGSRLVMVSARRGRRLEIRLPADHDRMAACFQLFDHLIGRRIDPLRSITVETINGEVAAKSPYIQVLHKRFDIVVEAPVVIVFRRMPT